MPKFITVTGYKGGTGKSTTAFHLAGFFSGFGKTLLVDGDPNRTCLNWASRAAQLPFSVIPEKRMQKALAGNDFIIFDTPARPNSEDLKELASGCDLLILPLSPDIVALEPMLEIAKDLSGKGNYRALITIVPPAPSREGEAMRADLKAAGVPVFESLIRRTINYQKAALAGCLIRELPDSRAREAWEDFEALGREILELI